MKGSDVFGTDKTTGMGGKQWFSLKKKNQNLIRFSLSISPLGIVSCEDLLLSATANKSNLPWGLTSVPASLLKWLEARFIPKNRAFVDKILGWAGSKNLINILDVTKGLSLTDDYWVTRADEDVKWENHNLYQNQFSDTLALLAFTGHGSNATGISSSPEYTTDGMLPKCWRRVDGTVYLYKGGTSGAANAGMEPYSEYYASQLAEHAGINHVSYTVEKWKGHLCSVCELFTSEDESFIPAYKVIDLKELDKSLASLPTEFQEALADMAIFDFVTVNSDRHFGNFGFIRDNNSGSLVRLAPLFDHGMSLLHQAMQSDFDSGLDDYYTWRKVGFTEIDPGEAKYILPFLGSRQKAILRKMVHFEFAGLKYDFPQWRLDGLGKLVRERAKLLLNA